MLFFVEFWMTGYVTLIYKLFVSAWCQAALKAVSSCVYISKLILECFRWLKKLSSFKDVFLVIPGRMGMRR